MDIREMIGSGGEISTQEAVELFLATIIGVVSLLFIFSQLIGHQKVLISLSAVFYSIIPVSIAIIAFLTYKVARMLYESKNFEHNSINAVVTALILAVVALNIGFMVIVSSGQVMLEGNMGMLRVSFLIVVLSLALSISVISRNMATLTGEGPHEKTS